MLFKLKPKYNLMKKTCVKTKQTKQKNKFKTRYYHKQHHCFIYLFQ